MNLLFWKHKEKKEIISNDCFSKLPTTHQDNYEQTDEEPTHKVEDADNEDGFTTTLIAAEETTSATTDETSDGLSVGSGDAPADNGPGSESVELGGGESGGAGATGDY